MTGKSILSLLEKTAHERGMTVILITHNQALTDMADRVIRVRSGETISNVVNHHPVSVDTIEW